MTTSAHACTCTCITKGSVCVCNEAELTLNIGQAVTTRVNVGDYEAIWR